ncbi:MAG: hypothetical protein DRI81_12115 [Chloroflexi bacterium]|nr:MAG: hypothetical protein DRI81_12115 [Chloroflexota bacterium]HEY73544.1 hypothetical protein [Thermoflexia bacterium]
MDSKVVAVIGLCVFLALWYGCGYLYNRNRGQRLFRWLEAGLDVLGGERESGWIGSPASGARVNIVHANPPFRRLEITLLLENREVPLLWLFDYLHGKRDRLIIKATLRSPRRGEIEVGSARRKAARRQEQPWTWQEEPHGLAAAYLGPDAQRQVKTLESWLETYGAHLHRFSWRKQDPHIQVQVNVGGLLATSSETFLADLQSAVKGATHVKKEF